MKVILDYYENVIVLKTLCIYAKNAYKILKMKNKNYIYCKINFTQKI